MWVGEYVSVRGEGAGCVRVDGDSGLWMGRLMCRSARQGRLALPLRNWSGSPGTACPTSEELERLARERGECASPPYPRTHKHRGECVNVANFLYNRLLGKNMFCKL